jgi:sigma-E factor negative regulatory protein RseA
MNVKQAELTSALLDGELDGVSQDRVVTSLLEGDGEARASFARYRLIGDTLRGESSVNAASVASAVSAALQDEPAILAPPRARPSRWLRPVAGAALAASVAAVAIVIAPGMMTPPNEASSPLVVAQEPEARMAPTLVAAGPAIRSQAAGSGPGDVAAERWQALDPELQARLNRLVIEHHEFSGRTGISGPVSHIGLVNYEGR